MTVAASRGSRPPGCLLLVAAAGFGKTAALGGDGRSAVYSAPTLVDRVAGLDWTPLLVDSEGVPVDRLGVDDLSEVPAREQLRLARGLAGLADRVRITVAARQPLSRTVVAALPQPVVEHAAADLALSPAAVARVLRDHYDVNDADLAYLVHDLTAGWPALVHFAGAELGGRGAGRDDLFAALTGARTTAAAWVREEVLAGLPPQVARQLETLSDLDPVRAGLCAALTRGSSAARLRALDDLRRLTRTGLLSEHPRYADLRTEPVYRVVPVISGVIRNLSRGTCGPAARTAATNARLGTAAIWYAGQGYPLASARALSEAGDHAGCVEMIAARGDEMLAAGGARELIRVIEELPARARTAETQLMLGDAYRIRGDLASARRAFAPLLEQTRRAGMGARLSWRVAMLDYMRGDYRGVLELLGPGEPGRAGQPVTADDVLTLVWRSSALGHLGRTGEAADCADRALRAAVAVGDDRSLAAAHTAAALSAVGVRRDEHLTRALERARRAGDIVQETRILVNKADLLLRHARYPLALAVAERAVRTAEAGSPPGMLVTALHNAGEALARLGRFDEALLSFERSLRICVRVGLSRAATALWGIGEVNRQLGRSEQSRVAFEEAAELSRSTGDLQTLVAVLIGLTRLLAAADLDAARAAADEAELVAPAGFTSGTRTARGWVALFDGDAALAAGLAEEALRTARSSRQAGALGEALELAAALSHDPGEARTALREAYAIWRQAGADPCADHILVRLGRLPGADSADRAAAESAADRLRALGVPQPADTHPLAGQGAATPLQIRVLGTFDVLVGGLPVPVPAWRSRQARTLLKILVARRGRPVRRGELCETLWPDDEPQRTAHRLSVLLSAVRTVLDPIRLRPADYYVRADLTGVCLDTSRVAVDVEDMLRDVEHGLALAAAGEPDRARAVLTGVDDAYRGDAFDDEPGADWADAVREEARAAWIQALRQLARLHRQAGALDQAATLLVRLLSIDQCDESAHRALVEVLIRAKRRGEARRAFGRWVAAMRSIDAPAPDPAVLLGARQGHAVASRLKTAGLR